jgi:hypothetical protein
MAVNFDLEDFTTIKAIKMLTFLAVNLPIFWIKKSPLNAGHLLLRFTRKLYSWEWISTVDLLELTSLVLVLLKTLICFLQHKEAKCTEPFPSVSVP